MEVVPSRNTIELGTHVHMLGYRQIVLLTSTIALLQITTDRPSYLLQPIKRIMLTTKRATAPSTTVVLYPVSKKLNVQVTPKTTQHRPTIGAENKDPVPHIMAVNNLPKIVMKT